MVQRPPEAIQSRYGLERYGFIQLRNEFWNLTTAALYEHALRNDEGLISQRGPLVVRTGTHTGRSPNDKFIVKDPLTADTVWWGKINCPFDPQGFERLLLRLQTYFRHRDVYVQDCFAGAAPRYRLPIRIITERAWHSLFAHTVFINATPEEESAFIPEFTIIQAPGFRAMPESDGTLSPTFILLDFSRKLVLIGGTEYAGEIKKAIFTVLNFLLPQQGILSMHCSANYGTDKSDAAVFFGLSGTGKTTLSTDPNRILIGDDEHGWSSDGIFNFEGGCYAKVIRLNTEREPEIYEKTQRFGTLLENVAIHPHTRSLDLDDDQLTENTRAAYAIRMVSNADVSGRCGHPRHVIFLTADAFGVLPPVAKLTVEQAMYFFLSGYTAKVAGTELGVTGPTATFSACFGAPFLPLHPMVYARLLREKLGRHQAQVWLVNTGWTGGPSDTGTRISLQHTRSIINAILDGSLKYKPTDKHAIFGLDIPTNVPDVPTEILNPQNTWSDRTLYDQKALELAQRFKENFAQYADQVHPDVSAAGPKV